MAATALKLDEESRHHLFTEVIEELHKFDVMDVAERAGVHFTTLYNWMRYETMWPSTRTLFAVAGALGFELKWVRKRGTERPQLRIVK